MGVDPQGVDPPAVDSPRAIRRGPAGGAPGATGPEATPGEGGLLREIWSELQGTPAAGAPAAGRGGRPAPLNDASPAPSPGGQPGEQPEAPDAALIARERAHLLRCARAVQALNERLQLDMDTPAHRLARDRLTAFVAHVSALSGVRADELVIGTGSDAFVVQNGPAGRSIARFDTHDAVNTPVAESLDGLAAAAHGQVEAQDAQAPPQPGVEPPKALRP